MHDARTIQLSGDLGYSRTEEQTREAIAPMLEAGTPPIVDHNASSSGTDVVGYLGEGPGSSAFVLDDGSVYQSHATTARGLEFLMATTGSSTVRRRDGTKATAFSCGSAGTTSTDGSAADPTQNTPAYAFSAG